MLFHLLQRGELQQTVSQMGYELSAARLERTASYYLMRTAHDSSLSRVTCAGALAQLDPEASWRMLEEALWPHPGSSTAARSREGVPLGAMAGTLDVVQRRYLGFDLRCDAIALDPAMPARFGGMRTVFQYRSDEFELEATGLAVHLRAAQANRSSVRVLL